jgi:hypothetical protein
MHWGHWASSYQTGFHPSTELTPERRNTCSGQASRNIWVLLGSVLSRLTLDLAEEWKLEIDLADLIYGGD